MLPNPIFELFGKGVYMYGICIAVGLIACIAVFYVYTSKLKTPPKVQDFMFIVAVVAIAVGFLFAKLYQAIYDWIEKGTFDFYNAGMTVMGGLIGGVIAFLAVYFGIGHFYFRGKEEGLHLKHFKDVFIVAPCCITVAHAFGRIGCLMSGCCHGKYLGEEFVFGGIFMHTPDDGAGYFVPTQLYEALFLFALFIVLTILLYKKCQITMHIYLIAYAVWRMFIEFFRADERGAMVLGLAPSQWQSILFALAGIALLIIYHIKGWKYFEKEKTKEQNQTKTIKNTK